MNLLSPLFEIEAEYSLPLHHIEEYTTPVRRKFKAAWCCLMPASAHKLVIRSPYFRYREMFFLRPSLGFDINNLHETFMLVYKKGGEGATVRSGHRVIYDYHGFNPTHRNGELVVKFRVTEADAAWLSYVPPPADNRHHDCKIQPEAELLRRDIISEIMSLS